jgi:hypothetical protein
MKLIKRPSIIYHISCCGNCFYNSSIYSEEGGSPVCQKLLQTIEDEKQLLDNCPLEEDHDAVFRLGRYSYIDRVD